MIYAQMTNDIHSSPVTRLACDECGEPAVGFDGDTAICEDCALDGCRDLEDLLEIALHPVKGNANV